MEKKVKLLLDLTEITTADYETIHRECKAGLQVDPDSPLLHLVAWVLNDSLKNYKWVKSADERSEK